MSITLLPVASPHRAKEGPLARLELAGPADIHTFATEPAGVPVEWCEWAGMIGTAARRTMGPDRTFDGLVCDLQYELCLVLESMPVS
jgi:hypothetical protein